MYFGKIAAISLPTFHEKQHVVVDGAAQAPERLDAPAARPEISYEMDTETLRALSAGEISGERAYLTRRLRLKASFSDMLKLQSLNKL